MARQAHTYRAAKRDVARLRGLMRTLRIERPHKHDRLTMKAIMRAHFRRNALNRWDGIAA